MSRTRLPSLLAAAALLISACGAPSATALAPTGSTGPSPASSAAGTPSGALASRGPGSSVSGATGSGSTPAPAPTRNATPSASPRATLAPTTAAPSARRSAAPAPTAVAAKIVDFGFTPAVLTVTVGTTVTWSNTGQVAHTVTANAGAFDSGTLPPGATFSFRFTKAGTFAYHCAIHPFMTGTVVVQG
jgi:plastocyanin